MRKQDLLIVALASTCCVASAQVVVNQSAPTGGAVHSAPPVTHSASVGGNSAYHGSTNQPGIGSGGSVYHGYQNGYSNSMSSHYGAPGTTGGYSRSLRGASLESGSLIGGGQTWHDSFVSHEGSRENFGFREGERSWNGSHEEGRESFSNHENHFEHGLAWKAPEWGRREGEHAYEFNHGREEEHSSLFHHEGWWTASRFADRGREYFGNLAKIAEKWTEPNGGTKVSAWVPQDGYEVSHAGSWGREAGFRSYWDYVPTFAWVRERASFFEERFLDWNWWR